MLTIENYGRRWRRDKIAWGAGTNKGHLNGTLKGRKSTVVNFRDQIGIYVLFNASNEPVYVGQAGIGKNKRLFGRLKEHRGDHLRDRWTYFSWFGLRNFNPGNKKLFGHHKPETAIRGKKRSDALHEIEAVLMSVIEPPLNKRGPNWMGAKEFFQFDDPTVPRTIEEIIGDIPKQLKALSKKIEALETKVKK